MSNYFDSQNNSHVLTEQIGIGGEGTVFVCPNDANLVAKIYHEPIDDQKAEKLVWMAEHKNEHLLKVAAWIVDVLRDAPDGKIVGFLMPNVKAKEIHELYSLKSRRVYFPHATWKFLLHTASNLARAFYSLHKNRHIMGDINHGNCVVLTDGTVKLIDCDSYSISRGDFRYPCEVGVATHLAPELQRVNLRGVEREEKHDNFGLAVILFQLLFLGRHPFAGNFLGGEDKSLEECIRENRFAYGTGATDRKVAQPPGTLSLSAVSPRLSLMFERAFLTEDRPAPHEWIEALEDLSANLKQCDLQPGHYFFNGLRLCPWCEIEAKTGLTLFPLTGEKQIGAGETKFNIFTVENLIQSFNIPSSTALMPPPRSNPLGISNSPLVSPSVSPQIEVEKQNHNMRTVKFAVAQFMMILLMSGFFGTGFAFMWSAIMLIFSLVYLSQTHRSIKDGAEYDLESARREMEKIETEWKNSDTKNYLETDLTLIRKKIADYENLQRESRVKMVRMRDEYFQNELRSYLNSFKISESKISGLNKENVLFLRNFNVKTAADIEIKKLAALPSNQIVTQKLLDWRANLERDFDYQPDHELPEAERQRFMARLGEKRGTIEREIEKLVITLRSGATLVNQKRQQLSGEAVKIADRILQAEHDIEAVGSNARAFVIMCVTTFLTLGAGSVLFSLHQVADRDSVKDNYINNIAANSRVMSDYAPPPPMPASNSNHNLPDTFNLTNEQIAALSENERVIRAYQLSDSVQLPEGFIFDNKENLDLPAAEKKMRVAVRLSPLEAILRNKLGNVLFREKKYAEAAELFKQSLKIDESDNTARSFIGMIDLQTGRYAEARKIFEELTETNALSYDWQFNLGIAYKNLKNYNSALERFEAAQRVSPDGEDARDEIDFCSKKLNYPPNRAAGEKDVYELRQDLSGDGIGSGSGTGNGSPRY